MPLSTKQALSATNSALLVLLTALLALTLLQGCKSSSSTGNTAAATSLPLPTASITVDGDPSDWKDVAAFYSDPANDQKGSLDQDLTQLFVAQDTTRIFVLLQVQGNLVLPHEATADSSSITVVIQPYFSQCATATQLTGNEVVNLIAAGTGLTSTLNIYATGATVTGTENIPIGALGNSLEFSFTKASLLTDSVYLTFTPSITSTTGTNTRTHDTGTPSACIKI